MSDSFFAKIDESRIVEAIRQAELRTRGEIRIHVTESRVDDVVREATKAFERLGMTATAERNGLLIFVAPRSQKFAVLGDSGITALAGTAPLDDLASSLSTEFRAGRFTEGLVSAVESAGRWLADHYPRTEGGSDRNELSDEISRG